MLVSQSLPFLLLRRREICIRVLLDITVDDEVVSRSINAFGFLLRLGDFTQLDLATLCEECLGIGGMRPLLDVSGWDTDNRFGDLLLARSIAVPAHHFL